MMLGRESIQKVQEAKVLTEGESVANVEARKCLCVAGDDQ